MFIGTFCFLAGLIAGAHFKAPVDKAIGWAKGRIEAFAKD